jgi:hypothetical protein
VYIPIHADTAAGIKVGLLAALVMIATHAIDFLNICIFPQEIWILAPQRGGVSIPNTLPEILGDRSR